MSKQINEKLNAATFEAYLMELEATQGMGEETRPSFISAEEIAELEALSDALPLDAFKDDAFW